MRGQVTWQKRRACANTLLKSNLTPNARSLPHTRRVIAPDRKLHIVNIDITHPRHSTPPARGARAADDRDATDASARASAGVAGTLDAERAAEWRPQR